MKLFITKGTTDVTLLIFIQDSSSTTGAGKTGVVASMLNAYSMRVEDDNDIATKSMALDDIVGTGTVHTDNGIEEIDSDNIPGWYRLDPSDSLFTTGARSVGISIIDAGANDIAQVTIEIQLIDVNLEDSVRGGMTALPNAAADAIGGLPISDAGGLDLDAILVDTGTSIPARFDTLDTNLTTIETDLATVDSNVDAILVDTNELQTDWTNSGRLDAILDIIAADTTTDIPALIATAQADLDTITDSDGVILGAAGVDLVWDEGNNAHNAKNTTGANLKRAAGGSEITIHSGTAQAGTANTITLDTGAEATDDIYNGNLITLTANTGVGQTRKIIDYVGSTKVATLDKNWVLIQTLLVSLISQHLQVL